MSKGGLRGAEVGRPFKKGTGADRDPRINSKGRPKTLPDLKELLIQVLGAQGEDGKTYMEKILILLRDRALGTTKEGDMRAGAELMDRAYTKAKQSSEMDITLGRLERLDEESLIELTNKIIEKQNGQK